MMCRHPVVLDDRAGRMRPCQQCKHCRINRRRVWVHRLLAESRYHEHKTMVTLTYAVEPAGRTLDPAHPKNFIKRLRRFDGLNRIRYYLVGEYGDETQRPHYHAILFGYPSCQRGRTFYPRKGISPECCQVCRDLWACWYEDPADIRDMEGQRGRIQLDEFNSKTAQYVCGYVLKKLTNPKSHRVRNALAGRHPEFCRQSRKPGIGYRLVHTIVSALLTPAGRRWLEESQEVPSVLRFDGKNWPLGRYLKEHLHEEIVKAGVPLSSPGYSPRAQERGQRLLDLQKLAKLQGAGQAAFLGNFVKHMYEAELSTRERRLQLNPQRRTL